MKMKLAPTYDEEPRADNLAGDGEQSHESGVSIPEPDLRRAPSRIGDGSRLQPDRRGPQGTKADGADQLGEASMRPRDLPNEGERPAGGGRQDGDLPTGLRVRPPGRGQRRARLRPRLGPSSNRAARRVVCNEGVVRPGCLERDQDPQTRPGEELLDEEIPKDPGQTRQRGPWIRRREGDPEREHKVLPAQVASLQIEGCGVTHIYATLDGPARTTLEPHVGGRDLMGRR